MIRSLKHHYRKLVIGKHLRAIDNDEEARINVLDALYFLRQAWNSVTQTTIANCYRHAGFKVTNDDSESATSNYATDDDDPLDDLPLARLIGNITMEEYVSVDDDVPTCEDLSEDSIVDDIIAARSTEGNTDADDDDDDGQTDEAAAEPPSVESALAACDTLRLFLHGQPGFDDVLRSLCNINKSVAKIDLS